MPGSSYFPIVKLLFKNPTSLKLFCQNPPPEFLIGLREIAYNLLHLPLGLQELKKIRPYLKHLKILASKSTLKQKKALLKRYGKEIIKTIVPLASAYIDG